MDCTKVMSCLTSLERRLDGCTYLRLYLQVKKFHVDNAARFRRYIWWCQRTFVSIAAKLREHLWTYVQQRSFHRVWSGVCCSMESWESCQWSKSSVFVSCSFESTPSDSLPDFQKTCTSSCFTCTLDGQVCWIEPSLHPTALWLGIDAQTQNSMS